MNTFQLLGPAIALTVALAACGQGVPSGNAQPATGAITPAEAQATGEAINDELISSSSALTVGDIKLQGTSSGGLSPQAAPCVTTDPDPVADTDGDGVPDNATFTYNCTRNGAVFTFTKTGTLKVSDPSTGPGGFDSEVNLTESRTNTLRGITVTDVRTGTRSPRKTGDQIVQSHNLTTKRSVTGQPDATIQNQWNLTFTATTPGSIVLGSPLPAGQFQVAGAYSITKDGKIRTHTLTTAVPLGYDPACTADLKIVSGTLLATVSSATGSGSVEVKYNACGTDPTITRTSTIGS